MPARRDDTYSRIQPDTARSVRQYSIQVFGVKGLGMAGSVSSLCLLDVMVQFRQILAVHMTV